MKCLQCHKTMHKASYHAIYCGYCTSCHSVLFTVSGLRSLVGDRNMINSLWAQAKYGNVPDGRYCLNCNRMMKKVVLKLPERDDVELDLCTGCQMVWFDAGELFAVPVYEPPEDPVKSMPPEAREKLALAQIREIESRAAGESEEDVSFVKHLISLLGVPVELRAPPLQRLPLLTWSIVLLCIVIYGISLWSGLDAAVGRFGFIPSEAWRYGGLTWLSSMLLHGGVGHLIGNMYFLLIFGDNSEDLLGKWRYLALILVSEFAGTLFFWLSEPSGTVPCVGASGFISGIIAFYCIALPGVKLMLRIKLVWSVQIYAWIWFLIWGVGQFIGAMASWDRSSTGGVAFVAHLGGAAAGGVAGLIYQIRNRFRMRGGSCNMLATDTGKLNIS